MVTRRMMDITMGKRLAGLEDQGRETLVVDLPLRRCNDRELTCFICHSREPCDYETDHRDQGRHVTISVHLACVKELRAREYSTTRVLIATARRGLPLRNDG
jgi:hypothetical protein